MYRIFIVEDDYRIAQDIERAEDYGCRRAESFSGIIPELRE